MGKLTLVGAGPGDPELITLKAIKALQAADVILYDALVSPELLNHSRESASKHYVGKRAGFHRFSQDSIHDLILTYARLGANVVRLKGGDPFVFGRGYEELAFAQSHGIPVDIVPGLSSSTSVPGLVGVPLTVRGKVDNFWVLTARTMQGAFSEDLDKAVASNATVVILMGVGRLGMIARRYVDAGKGKLPAMVVQSGSLPSSRTVVGAIRDLPNLAETANIGTPGLIVIGETVSLHPDYPTEPSHYFQKTKALPVCPTNYIPYS